jgi:transposase
MKLAPDAACGGPRSRRETGRCRRTWVWTRVGLARRDNITVVADRDAGTVEYIADERSQASLDSYAERLTAELLEVIEAVALDMWDPYANLVRPHLPNPDSKIVFDRFHLMGYPRARSWTPCATRRTVPCRRRRQDTCRIQVPVTVLLGNLPDRARDLSPLCAPST